MIFFDRLIKTASFLSSFSLVLLVVLVVYDALMRYFFSQGSIAIQEFQWHLFDVVILFSIAYTMHHNAHVRVDIFYDNFSQRVKNIINLASLILFITPLSLLIIYVGFEFVSISFSQMECSSNPGGLSYRYIVKALMPIAFIFVLLQSVREILINIKELRV
ncbi:MAG: TRAP transporter small permease subunit [Helicobacteraceae bacterium]|nr:TRAP transporter small permease subunit [Helicobacteraceae bacterium]